MEINSTSFGYVTVNNKTYNQDIWIFVDKTIEQRTKNHIFSTDELELLSKDNPEIIIIGTGQSGCVEIEEKAKQLAKEKNIELITEITPIAIKKFNELKDKKIAAAIHVTC